MTTKFVKWASNDGQIIKSGLSDGRRVIFLPTEVEFAYDWLRIDGYLGNFGLDVEASLFGSARLNADRPGTLHPH